MTAQHADNRGRVLAIIGVAAIHAMIAFALLHGLGVEIPRTVSHGLTVLNILPPPPPPPPDRVSPQHRTTPRKAGAAAPPNLRAKTTDVVAPAPIVPPPLPPPLPTAPIAGVDAAPLAGAASIRGPGTGSGGTGHGTGSGGSGDGDGGGGSPLRLKSGRIRDSDYPRAALEAGASGTVGLAFTVGVTGRVTQCSVTRSSGNAALDETTCRLIQERFRYKPSTDASGRPVPDQVEGEHVWTLYRRDRPDDDPR